LNRTGTALVCAALLCLNGPAFGDSTGPDSEKEFSARVIAVLDGDTVLILRKAAGQRTGGLMKIRLAEIDAPEKEQAYGTASRSSLQEMVWHRQVWVHPLAVDKYGRTVAQLEVNGLKVNEEMVRLGMAWEYSHYHSDRRYISIEQEARQAKRGLWAQRDPVPPWLWRLRHVTGEASRLRDDAHKNLTVCGVKALNPAGDGIPCEKLCAGAR
jgi:micrococcal nuclease